MVERLKQRVERHTVEAGDADTEFDVHVTLTVSANDDPAAERLLARWAPDTPEGRDNTYLLRTLLGQEMPLKQEVYPAIIFEFAEDLVIGMRESDPRFTALYDAAKRGDVWTAPNAETGNTLFVHVYSKADDRNKALAQLMASQDCLQAARVFVFVEIQSP